MVVAISAHRHVGVILRRVKRWSVDHPAQRRGQASIHFGERASLPLLAKCQLWSGARQRRQIDASRL